VNFISGKASSLSISSGQVVGVDVVASDGQTLSIACDNLVIAAGPWTGPLSQLLLPNPIPVTSYGGNSVVLRLRSPTTLTADGLFILLNVDDSSYYPEVFTRPSGEIYLAGINESLQAVLPPTPEEAIPQESAIKQLKAIADEILPEYTVEKTQLCFRPMTEQGLPFISPIYGVAGAYVGAGHSFFGIMLGPGTGKILSEMVLGDELSIDVSNFSLAR
jgi:glycine/D-amino acid oxidase-like deaminating enzyme